MRKKRIIVLMAIMMSAFTIINAHAWEVLDTDGDGVNDTIQFCDGYREPIEKYMITQVCPEDPPPSWLDSKYLDFIDEMCRKNPGYLEQEKARVEKIQKDAIESRKYRRLEYDVENEIVIKSTNDSMSYTDKIFSVLNYIKTNYLIQEDAEDYKYNSEELQSREYLFLSHKRSFNKKDYNGIVFKLLLNDGIIDRHIDGFVTYAEDGTSQVTRVGDHYYDLFKTIGNKLLVLIDGNWYEFDPESLEFTEGLSENSVNTICNWPDSGVNPYRPDNRGDERCWKNMPEEIKKRRRALGNHIPFED